MYPVELEVNAAYGDPIIVIVGLPDAAVKESRDWVMTALISSGFNSTFGRTTLNLAPAGVKKEGLSSIASAKEEPSLDLPIAIGMVAASEQTETDQLEYLAEMGFAEVKVQESVKRAMEIAIAGGHNML